MSAPYSLPDTTEYGVEYVLLVEDHKPRTFTVWNGVERSYSERLVNHMRNRVPPRGVAYLRPRLVTRYFEKGKEVKRMEREHMNAAMRSDLPTMQTQDRPSGIETPPSFWKPSRRERYLISIDLDTWSTYGTKEGDAFITTWIERQLQLYDFTLNTPKKKPTK